MQNRGMSRIAAILARMPVLTVVMRVAFRQLQAKYTAGVVGVIVNEGGEILIVEHVFHPGWSWGLPGGWLGKREQPSAGLQRELREELGLDVKILHPLLVDLGAYSGAHLDMSFLCRSVGQISQVSRELLGFQWVRPEDAPRMLPFHAASVRAAMVSRNAGVNLLWE